jgi:hypothetical protein
MSATIKDGRSASIRLGADEAEATISSLQSINFPAGVSQIDLTTVDDATSGYQSSRPGLKTGSFTFTCLYDTANTALLARCADGALVNVYARIDKNDVSPLIAWSGRLAADIQTGGVASAASMTVTVYREGNAA